MLEIIVDVLDVLIVYFAFGLIFDVVMGKDTRRKDNVLLLMLLVSCLLRILSYLTFL